LFYDPFAVPGQGDFGGVRFHEKQAGISDIDFVGGIAADADFAAGDFTVFAVALVGGDDEGFAVFGKENFNKVLYVFNQGDAFVFRVGVNVELRLGVVELFNDLRGDFGGETLVARGSFFAGNFFYGVVNGHFDLFAAKGNHQA